MLALHSRRPQLKLHPKLHEATFIARLNRFTARMRHDGREVMVHVANSGRLEELLRPEHPMYLTPAPPESLRKTAYTLALVEVNGALVSADARLPNALVREAIEADVVPELAGYRSIAQEVRFGESRLDLVLSGLQGQCYVEVKSVTLVENGVGLFPDAPTERGRKHVRSLGEAIRQGHRAAAVFVIQRPDVRSFSPNEVADPHFCETLRESVALGVEVYAYRCAVTRSRIDISKAVPVRIA